MCTSVPGKVLSVGTEVAGCIPAEVDFGGRVRQVNLVLVPEVNAGDHVIVHAGFALRRIPPEEAAAILALIESAAS